MDLFVVLVCDLDPQFEQPLTWREHSTCGSQATATRLAATLRTNGTAVRVLPDTDFALAKIRMDAQAERDKPRTLFGVAIVDPNGGMHSVLHESGWMSQEDATALAQRLSVSLNVRIVESSGNR